MLQLILLNLKLSKNRKGCRAITGKYRSQNPTQESYSSRHQLKKKKDKVVRMRRFIATCIATMLAGLLILTIFLTGVDVAAEGGTMFTAIATHKMVRILAAFLFIALGLCIDLFAASQRAKREKEIQAQRLIVFKARMRTVHQIVNNALNEMQLFRLNAEGLMPEESLMSFDELIKRTAAKLKALGDLESIPDRESPIGRTIDYERNSPAR